jgi:hypothetical protein
MANYTKTVNFAAKDSLTTGNPAKIVKGTEINTEFTDIATAIATKADTSSVPTLSGSNTLSGTNTFSAGVTMSSSLSKTANASDSVLLGSSYSATAGVTPVLSGVATGSTQIGITAQTSGSGFIPLAVARQNTSHPLTQFAYTASAYTEVGTISTNGSSVSYNTSSDYRLKENVATLTNAVTRVKQLNPVRFTWINNPAAGTVDGFIAHEVSPVVPEAVVGAKDATNPDGSIRAQGIDQAKLVPLLVAAIKELTARVEALEAV